MSLPDTRHSLLARLAEPADAAAWEEFVQIYEQAVFRYSRGRGLQDADAWEVVQQVLLVVHRRIAQWRPNGQPGAFRSWLLTTAHRVCQHAIRDSRRPDRGEGGSLPNQVLLAPADFPETRDWRQWAFCWAAAQVERDVEPATWKAFTLTALDGLTATAAAERLGIRVGSVYTAKCRVMARIRELVRQLAREDE